MTANNKVLLVFIAIVAFVIGAALNSAQVSDDIQTELLLNAELRETNPSNGQESVGRITNKLGELTLVNFWASWCAPCREEMPVFESIYRAASKNGFQIIGVAIDSVEKAQPMLDSMDITYPILYAEQTGMEIMESAGNPQGLLPYSLLLDKNGDVIEQVLGRIDEKMISSWLAAANISFQPSSPRPTKKPVQQSTDVSEPVSE